MRHSFAIACSLVAVAACSSKPGAAPSVAPPTDQSTSEQRAELGDTLTRIENLTSELGQPLTFRRLPIVVTDDSTFTDHLAGCVSVNGVPQFIVIKPMVFAQEATFRKVGTDSTIFRVVLHELGHCYFNRQHEETHLTEPEKTVAMPVPGGKASEVVYYSELDETVMVPEALTLPVPLEKYYVAELLGLAHAHSLADIAAYAAEPVVRQPWLANAGEGSEPLPTPVPAGP